ncbi:ATP-dependent RNA helicase DDX24 [Anthonomus grandis grandis]|uniref:ATP-dependent RNA helicase DDX24 n=1 Tax=Anthonomus grandis grandis TaxID=2921223 RepID=UPI0021663F58|nr:ATP-dependent RNA helicase DDX24 [Anthonomus grandis grandis]
MPLVAANWKPVKLEGNLSNIFSEGLIGIEECIDYNPDDFVVTTKGKKRKNDVENTSQPKKSKTNSKSSEINKEDLSPSKSGNTEQNDQWYEGNQTQSELCQSMKAWDQYCLPETVIKALCEQQFYSPTEIQAFTLPSAILGKRDILGAAETGSGKTLAFGLPIISGILRLKENEPNSIAESSDLEDESDFQLDEDGIGCVKSLKLNSTRTKKPLYALILTPTRELAMQVKNHLCNVAKYTGLNVAVVVGGMAAVKQERILSKGPEIVVGTPGRLWELIQQGNEHLAQIDNIRFLAIDETDRMLEKGHFKELHDLLERINMSEDNKKNRQNFVFSATLTLIHDIPKHLFNKNKLKGRKLKDMTPEQKLQKIVDTLGVTNPKIVDLSEGIGTSTTLTECRITCQIDEKDYYVYYFLKKHPGRTLIFCNSIGCVKRLTTLLSLLDCSPLPLHASMQQRQRLKNLERFRDVEDIILIATDVAARGLDIPKIDHVLHYQTPRTSESYVHRSGRTARASKQGITVVLMEPNEFSNYLKLCKTLSKGEDLPIFPVQEKFLNAVKERVNLARELDKLQLQVKKANSEEGWLQKAAKEMDIIVDEMTKKYDGDETAAARKRAEATRKRLSTLLATPVFPTGFSGKFPLLENAGETVFQAVSKDLKAVDVMKSAMENNKKLKRKQVALFKPKNKDVVKKDRNVIIKLNKNKQNFKSKRSFKRKH